MRGDPRRADADGDDQLTLAELTGYIADFSWRRTFRLARPESVAAEPATTASRQPAGGAPAEVPAEGSAPRRDTQFVVSAARLPAGLPPWFLQRDADGDGQLTLLEFAPQSVPADLAEFAELDHNQDGLVTPREFGSWSRGQGGSRSAGGPAPGPRPDSAR
jgi:hypothetical protein